MLNKKLPLSSGSGVFTNLTTVVLHSSVISTSVGSVISTSVGDKNEKSGFKKYKPTHLSEV